MEELKLWLEAAEAAYDLCQNKGVLDQAIAAQKQRLLGMYFPELRYRRLCYQTVLPTPWRR